MFDWGCATLGLRVKTRRWLDKVTTDEYRRTAVISDEVEVGSLDATEPALQHYTEATRGRRRENARTQFFPNHFRRRQQKIHVAARSTRAPESRVARRCPGLYSNIDVRARSRSGISVPC